MIEVRGLGYTYPNGREVLRGVDFSLKKGGRLGVVGHNGSGKSTLARLLCGLEVPASGSVTVDGLLTSDEESTYEVRRRVGLVFQDPEQQMVETTVEREIGFGPRNIGLHALRGLTHKLDNRVHVVPSTQRHCHENRCVIICYDNCFTGSM